jgi:acyl dehydratase
VQDIVPAPSRLQEVLALASLNNVRFPEIVRVTEELTVRVEVDPTDVKVRFAHAALAVTVTV